MQSTRKDGRGHWPAGRRRNPDAGQWSRTRLALQSLLDEHWQQGVRSERAVAAALGVSPRSLGRWLAGSHRPHPDYQELLAAWVAEQRTLVKRRPK